MSEPSDEPVITIRDPGALKVGDSPVRFLNVQGGNTLVQFLHVLYNQPAFDMNLVKDRLRWSSGALKKYRSGVE